MRVGRVPQATTPSACMRHHKTVEFPDKVCRGREKRTRETARGDSHSCNGRILTHTAMQLAITDPRTDSLLTPFALDNPGSRGGWMASR